MTPYLVAYLFYFVVLLSGVEIRHLRFSMVIASLPLIGLSLLRGLVGTDTPMYLQSIDLIRAAGKFTFTFEPLFEYLVLLLGGGINDSMLILVSMAALTTTILYATSIKIEKCPILFCSTIIPYFYLDMTMNAVRYGLAFSLVYLGVYFLLEGNRKLYFVFCAIAALVQLSSLALSVLLWVLDEMRWRTLAFSALLVVVVYIVFYDYIGSKVGANQLLAAPSLLSGGAPLLLSVLTLFVLWSDDCFRKFGGVQLRVLLVGSLLTFFSAKFLYAGLRFQLLNYSLILLVAIFITRKYSICFGKKTIYLLFLIGALSAIFRLANFNSEADVGEAPFIPYKSSLGV